MIEFQEGMICFSGPRKGNFIQNGIKFFTGSKFTHSFVVTKYKGELCALETTATKVVCEPVKVKYQEDNYIECWMPKEEHVRLLIEVQSKLSREVYLGSWYGYFSYFWFIYRFISRKFGYEPKKMWRWASWWITCTELTCKSLPENLKPFQDDNTIAPQELREYFLNKCKAMNCVGWITPREEAK